MNARRPLAFIKMMRPINCLMVASAVFVGATVTLKASPQGHIARLLLGALTGWTLFAASNAVNDYHDREIDAINEPNRPIPSGLVRPWEALAFAAVLSATGLLSAFYTGLKCLALALIALAVSTSYATWGKRMGLLGNMMVSLCIAIPFLYGGIIVAGAVKPLTAVFSAIAFLANVGREVTKGIVDVEGDEAQGVKTVAVAYGRRTAAAAAAAFYLLAVALTPVPPVLGEVSFWYIPIVLVVDGGFLWSSVSLLRSPTRSNARRVKNQVLAWMCLGLAAFVAGAL